MIIYIKIIDCYIQYIIWAIRKYRNYNTNDEIDRILKMQLNYNINDF